MLDIKLLHGRYNAIYLSLLQNESYNVLFVVSLVYIQGIRSSNAWLYSVNKKLKIFIW